MDDEYGNKLNIGDTVVVTYNNQYHGETGEIIDFSPSGDFVIVSFEPNRSRGVSMSLSDVRKVSKEEASHWEQEIHSDGYDFEESIRPSIKETLKDYDNQIENAIASVLGIDEKEAKQVLRMMSFEDYMSFTMAIERNDMEEANEIVNSYVRNKLDVSSDSIAQEMHYRIRQDEPNVIVSEFKMMNELKQREILSEMTNTELQKILANLRGYENPGLYESSLFDVHMLEEILRRTKDIKIKNLLEVGTITTQKPVSSSGSQNKMTPRTAVSVKNDAGEAEDAEVVSDTGSQVTVRTKQGVKRMNKDQVTKKAVQEEHEDKLNIGDTVVVTYNNQYHGETGEIIDFSPSGDFVIVSFEPNRSRGVSMSLSDVRKVSDNGNDAELNRLKELAGIKK